MNSSRKKKSVLGKSWNKVGYKHKSTVSPVNTPPFPQPGTSGSVLNPFPFPFVNKETGNQTFLWQWLLGGVSVTNH